MWSNESYLWIYQVLHPPDSVSFKKIYSGLIILLAVLYCRVLYIPILANLHGGPHRGRARDHRLGQAAGR